MVNIQELEPGMNVKIVDEWTPDGECWEAAGMDKWLGQIMTIKQIHDDLYVTMEEDFGDSENHDRHWHWPEPAIECIVYDDELAGREMYIANYDEIMELFSGVVA